MFYRVLVLVQSLVRAVYEWMSNTRMQSSQRANLAPLEHLQQYQDQAATHWSQSGPHAACSFQELEQAVGSGTPKDCRVTSIL